MQGQHFAACQGKGHLADAEVLELKDLYGDPRKPQSVATILSKVCTRLGCMMFFHQLRMMLSEAVLACVRPQVVAVHRCTSLAAA